VFAVLNRDGSLRGWQPRHFDPQEVALEIYAFTNVTDWDAYEKIQSDIFDHILSVLPEFELRAFQNPAEFNYEQMESMFGHRIEHHTSLAVAEAEDTGTSRKKKSKAKRPAKKKTARSRSTKRKT
jgi:hypothetical protein